MVAARTGKSKSKASTSAQKVNSPSRGKSRAQKKPFVFKERWKFPILIVVLAITSYYVYRSIFDNNIDGTGKNENIIGSASASGGDVNNNGKEKKKIHTSHNKQKKRSSGFSKGKSEFESSICPKLSVLQSLDYDGRQLKAQELKHNNKESSVRVFLIDNFLTKEECDGLSAVHLRYVQQSNAIGPLMCFAGLETFRKYLKAANIKRKVSETDFVTGTNCINETFSSQLKEKFSWSFSTAFYRSESKFSQIYENRIENVTKLLNTHGGKFQVTSYPQKVGYKSHTDCTMHNADLRDRYATTLVYLQNVKEGGETVFTKLGISVQPKQGRLLVWNNMNTEGECDHTSLHQAAPVIKGRKFILQRWYYYKNFPTLGKRPPEPPIPARKERQPRVSCDYFEEGSCRWYDEWGYDHVHDYNNIHTIS